MWRSVSQQRPRALQTSAAFSSRLAPWPGTAPLKGSALADVQSAPAAAAASNMVLRWVMMFLLFR
jgi:hypothetical protein